MTDSEKQGRRKELERRVLSIGLLKDKLFKALDRENYEDANSLKKSIESEQSDLKKWLNSFSM